MQKLIEKFKKHGYEARKVLMDIRDIVITPEFTMYAPTQRWPYGEKRRSLYELIYNLAKTSGTPRVVLDTQHLMVDRKKLKISNTDISTLYEPGYIGHDFEIKSYTIEHVLIPKEVKEQDLPDTTSGKNEVSKVPGRYWSDQAFSILDKKGWTPSNIDDLDRNYFEPYRGEKIKATSLSTLKKNLRRRLKSRDSGKN
jgi:hypothetical protein